MFNLKDTFCNYVFTRIYKLLTHPALLQFTAYLLYKDQNVREQTCYELLFSFYASILHFPLVTVLLSQT